MSAQLWGKLLGSMAELGTAGMVLLSLALIVILMLMVSCAVLVGLMLNKAGQ